MVARESGAGAGGFCVFLADSPSVRSRRASGALTSGLSARPYAVIRRLGRDLHVVGVGFAEARATDADEARLRAQILDRGRADVAHTQTQTANELIHERRERAASGHASFDALGHELAELRDVLLPVAIARSLPHLHRAERAHPAIRLEASLIGLDHVARRFVDAGKESAEHDRVRAGADRLRDVA